MPGHLPGAGVVSELKEKERQLRGTQRRLNLVFRNIRHMRKDAMHAGEPDLRLFLDKGIGWAPAAYARVTGMVHSARQPPRVDVPMHK
jgi:hypothetical protein